MSKDILAASLIERLQHYQHVGTMVGNRTNNPLNAVRLVEEAIELIVKLAEATVDLDANITDWDGVDASSQIMSMFARTEILMKVKK